ncbi:MAG: chorismate synthase [Bacteroidales bacterium]|nr:chorismate synthase [Bacteroidales bacterium]
MNTLGHNFRLTLFGESHGPVVGVTLDGVPAGVPLSENDFSADLSRRSGAGLPFTTSRHEDDIPEIISGVFRGFTTGAPLTVIIRNKNTESSDYAAFADIPRPGHADLTARLKYGGFNDPRGSGEFSGRMTAGIVVAGTVARKVLGPEVRFEAQLSSLGGIPARMESGNLPAVWMDALEKAAAEGDSLGAVVSLKVEGVPQCMGEPFFDGMEAVLSHAFFSIPGVRGVEFGDGFRAASMKGSEHNDPIGEDGMPLKNGSGGFAGGITTGAPLLAHIAFKPTSSISRMQKTYNFAAGKMDDLSASGRHDTCFALRTPVIVEALAAVVLADNIVK